MTQAYLGRPTAHEAAWDEAEKARTMTTFTFAGGTTQSYRIEGEITPAKLGELGIEDTSIISYEY